MPTWREWAFFARLQCWARSITHRLRYSGGLASRHFILNGRLMSGTFPPRLGLGQHTGDSIQPWDWGRGLGPPLNCNPTTDSDRIFPKPRYGVGTLGQFQLLRSRLRSRLRLRLRNSKYFTRVSRERWLSSLDMEEQLKLTCYASLANTTRLTSLT